MTTYEWLLFGHLLAMTAWVGGDIMLQVLSIRAQRGGPEKMGTLLGDVEWVGGRLLTTSGVLVVVFGFLLVNELNYDLGQTWLVLALVVFALSFLAGAGFLGPESGRVGKLIEERGAADPEVQRRIGRIFWVSRVELLLLIAIILDMVAKPGL